MIAEENSNQNSNVALTGAENATLNRILTSMKLAVAPFKQAYSQANLCHPLNENQMTQILVEQIEAQRKRGLMQSIGVKNHYSDIFEGTKGIPDFYFHKVEEGKTHRPLLVVESKRLPAPNSLREKEYVVGNSNNGGIERYKTEKHGKGFSFCGMVGFVEEKTFRHWQTTINQWIIDLSQGDNFWKNDEILLTSPNEHQSDYCVLRSTAHRNSAENVRLYHLWISLQ
jgi:hypothetical protein